MLLEGAKLLFHNGFSQRGQWASPTELREVTARACLIRGHARPGERRSFPNHSVGRSAIPSRRRRFRKP
jgi:hypothetical protein